MNQGTVKFFNNDKGFGFIKDDESNTEYFVHVTGLVDQIEGGIRKDGKASQRQTP